MRTQYQRARFMSRSSAVGVVFLLLSLFTTDARANVIVSYYYDHDVRQFNTTTGANIGPYVTPGAGGLGTCGGAGGPWGMALGPDGNLYVADENCNAVFRFNGASGALLGSFAVGPRPRDVAFGPDGLLYVSFLVSGYIEKFDPLTGQDMGRFAFMDSPHDLLFLPSGDILVSSFFSGAILRFNQAGTPLGTLANVNRPRGMQVGPDGNLYVATSDSFQTNPANGVYRFTLAGVPLGQVVVVGTGGFTAANDVAFAPDGTLFVTDPLGVLRFNATTGAFIENFIPTVTYQPFNLIITPDTWVSWPQPESISYGTPLNSLQLNAASESAGTFTYAPAAGTVLDAGTHTLSVTFTPATGQAPTISTVSLTVDKAAAVMSLTTGTFTYDGAPHGASATASGVFGEALAPVTVTYNGETALPVQIGSYSVLLSFDGSANYLPSTATGALRITHHVCVLFDQTRPVRSGSTIPITLQLCDAGGRNVSSADRVITAQSIVLVSAAVSASVQDSGNANPDNNFRFVAGKSSTGGFYIFNLKTTGLITGTYHLEFTVGGDPVTHAVQFQVK